MSRKRREKEKEEPIRSDGGFSFVGGTLAVLVVGTGFLATIADDAGYHYFSRRVYPFIFATCFGMGTLYVMIQNARNYGEVSMIGLGLVRREERPVVYWLLWLVPIAVALAVMVFGVLLVLNIIPVK
jgi:hypothetical protein